MYNKHCIFDIFRHSIFFSALVIFFLLFFLLVFIFTLYLHHNLTFREEWKSQTLYKIESIISGIQLNGY